MSRSLRGSEGSARVLATPLMPTPASESGATIWRVGRNVALRLARGWPVGASATPALPCCDSGGMACGLGPLSPMLTSVVSWLSP